MARIPDSGRNQGRDYREFAVKAKEPLKSPGIVTPGSQLTAQSSYEQSTGKLALGDSRTVTSSPNYNSLIGKRHREGPAGAASAEKRTMPLNSLAMANRGVESHIHLIRIPGRNPESFPALLTTKR